MTETETQQKLEDALKLIESLQRQVETLIQVLAMQAGSHQRHIERLRQ